jgi:SAM-dependent methyltransferase
MTPDERWLAAGWPFVREHLPAAPARVVDLGCGSLGGFVPMLRACGYDAFGIDPQAPDEPAYHRRAFESAAFRRPLDAVVASTSLHHVADPAAVIDAITTALSSRGTLLVIEWAWEDFDAETAAWCFDRLGPDGESGWLHRRRDEWLTSRRDWSTYIRAWAKRERLHRGGALLSLLDARLERRLLARGPYFFRDLADTSEADEQAAIDAGHVRATRIDYVGAKGG